MFSLARFDWRTLVAVVVVAVSVVVAMVLYSDGEGPTRNGGAGNPTYGLQTSPSSSDWFLA